jgi:hypothetical protein
MPTTSARQHDYYDTDTATDTAKRANYPSLYYTHLNTAPERKWEVEVVRALVRLAGLRAGWDSYRSPPPRRDAGHFALEVLHGVMRPRTPLPQVVPASGGGIQLEGHEKGIDLELHITAPYQCELWFQDHQDQTSQPISLELTDDFSELKRPIALLTNR